MTKRIHSFTAVLLTGALLLDPAFALARSGVAPSPQALSFNTTPFMSQAFNPRLLWAHLTDAIHIRHAVTASVLGASVLGFAQNAFGASRQISSDIHLYGKVAEQAVQEGARVITVVPQHIVQAGDSFWKIASQHHVSYQELLKLNPQFADPGTIFPMDAVNLPGAAADAIHLVDPLSVLPVHQLPHSIATIDPGFGFIDGIINTLQQSSFMEAIAAVLVVTVVFAIVRYRQSIVQSLRTPRKAFASLAVGVLGLTLLTQTFHFKDVPSPERETPDVPALAAPQPAENALRGSLVFPPTSVVPGIKLTQKPRVHTPKPFQASVPAPEYAPLAAGVEASRTKSEEEPVLEETRVSEMPADQPVVTMSWQQMVGALMKQHEESARLDGTYDETTSLVESLAANPLFTIAPFFTSEPTYIKGAGFGLATSIPLQKNPLAKSEARASAIHAGIHSEKLALALYARLEALSNAQRAWELAQTPMDREAVRIQVSEMVMPALTDVEPSTRFEVAASDSDVDYLRREATASKARLAALTLAAPVDDVHQALDRESIHPIRRAMPTRAGINVNPVAAGGLGHLFMIAPQWNKYGGLDSPPAEAQRLEAALMVWLAGRHSETKGDMQGTTAAAYEQEFVPTVRRGAMNLESDLRKYLRKHPEKTDEFAPLLTMLKRIRELPAEKYTPPTGTQQDQDVHEAISSLDIGSLSFNQGASVVSPVIGITPGDSSASPWAATIENRTYTFGTGGTINLLLNSHKLKKWEKAYVEAIQESSLADTAIKKSIAMYKAAVTSAHLTPSQRSDFQLAFSAQGSPHYGYFVLNVPKGAQEGAIKLVRLLIGKKSRVHWNVELEQAVWHAHFEFLRAQEKNDSSAGDLYYALLAATPGRWQKDLLNAWSVAPHTLDGEALAIAQMRLAHLKKGGRLDAPILVNVMPMVTDTVTKGTRPLWNFGVMGSASLNVNSRKESREKRQAMTQMAQADVDRLEQQFALEMEIRAIRADTASKSPSHNILITSNVSVLAERIADAEQTAEDVVLSSIQRFSPQLQALGFWHNDLKGVNVTGPSFTVHNPKLKGAKLKQVERARAKFLAQREASRRASIISVMTLIGRQILQAKTLDVARLEYQRALGATGTTIEEGLHDETAMAASNRLLRAAMGIKAAENDLRETDAVIRSRLQVLPAGERETFVEEISIPSFGAAAEPAQAKEESKTVPVLKSGLWFLFPWNPGWMVALSGTLRRRFFSSGPKILIPLQMLVSA